MSRPEQSRYDDIVDAITAWNPDCRASKVFGMPCVKRSRRVVFGLSRTGMVFKLRSERLPLVRALWWDHDPLAKRLTLPGRVEQVRAGDGERPRVRGGVGAGPLHSSLYARCVNQHARAPSR